MFHSYIVVRLPTFYYACCHVSCPAYITRVAHHCFKFTLFVFILLRYVIRTSSFRPQASGVVSLLSAQLRLVRCSLLMFFYESARLGIVKLLSLTLKSAWTAGRDYY